jgi:hypothetical protein
MGLLTPMGPSSPVTYRGGYNPALGPPGIYSTGGPVRPPLSLGGLVNGMGLLTPLGPSSAVTIKGEPGRPAAPNQDQAPAPLLGLTQAPSPAPLLGLTQAPEPAPLLGLTQEAPQNSISSNTLSNDQINMMLLAMQGAPAAATHGAQSNVGLTDILNALMPDLAQVPDSEHFARMLFAMQGAPLGQMQGAQTEVGPLAAVLDLLSQAEEEEARAQYALEGLLLFQQKQEAGTLSGEFIGRDKVFTALQLGEWPGDPNSKIVVVIISDLDRQHWSHRITRPWERASKDRLIPKKVMVYRVGHGQQYQNIPQLLDRAKATQDAKTPADGGAAVGLQTSLGYVPLFGTSQQLDNILIKLKFGKDVATGEWVWLGVSFAGDVATVGPGVVKSVAALRKLNQARLLSALRAAREARLVSLPLREGPKCFAAGTPLLTPEGAKAVECLRPGDLVLSRAEEDVGGVIEAKAVEEVFVRVALVLAVQVRGRVIRTTAEHPFYVFGRGWVSACYLCAGDLLASQDGQVILVERVAETREVATVYNVRVADYHTYFVGCGEWGFSVWAHNAEYQVFADVYGTHSIRYWENGKLKVLETPLGDPIRFKTAAEAEAWITRNAAGVPGKLPTGFEGYLRQIEDFTGVKLTESQSQRLKAAWQQHDKQLLSRTDYAKHLKKWEQPGFKDKVIDEWEKQTGQKWPVYSEDVVSPSGRILRAKGERLDAHHIIEKSYNGPHEWWNIHPARYPDIHQGKIHGADGLVHELMPQRK